MPENINQTDVQTTLAKKIENQEALKNAEELKDVALAEGNIQVLKSILTREEGEDEAEHAAEQAALKTAIEETAVAHEAEGVTPTLIRMWIYGEDIDNSLDALGELSVDSYSSILSSPEATQIVQKIARQLEIDIGDGGDNEDGVDGKYGALTTEAVGKIQEALIKAGLLPATMENGNSNQDGKFGKRTLAALRGAVKTEEECMPDWIITDVRFPNEADIIKRKGGIVLRVNRFCYDSAEDFLVTHPDEKLRKIGIYDYNTSNIITHQEMSQIAKDNGYQSIHTMIMGPFNNKADLQIRTKKMDVIASKGIAAHWIYKQNN